MPSNNILRFPIKVLLIWNIATIILFIFSPFDWPIDSTNFSLLILFLAVCLIFLSLGYKYGLRSKWGSSCSDQSGSMMKWLNYSILVRLIWILPSYCDRLGLDLYDFKTLLLRLALGFTDFGESYAYRSLIEFEKTGIIFFFTKQLLYAFSAMAIPLGILLWRKINTFKKFIIVSFIFLDIFFWMGIGTNVGVINNFITIYFLLAVVYPKITNISTLKLKYKLYIIAVPILLLLLFTINISQRYDFNYKGRYNIYDNEINNAKINKENIIFTFTPSLLHSTIISASNYLNQGYYHTALAFDEDFDWTYGIGNNYTTLGISPKIAGEDLTPKTYIWKLEKKGVDPIINWHSAYLWFANDFSFWGVPVFLFMLGLLFAITWKSTLNSNDPFAPIIFIYCAIEIFYLCANNHVFSFSFYPFHIIIFFWITNKIFNGGSKRISTSTGR